MTPEQHDQRWPWCHLGDRRHTHTEQLNGPSLVNGRPAGPMLLLRLPWHYRSRGYLP
jgi:hypothetical protein